MFDQPDRRDNRRGSPLQSRKRLASVTPMARTVGWVPSKSGKSAEGSWRVRVSHKDSSGQTKWDSATVKAKDHGGKRSSKVIAEKLAIRMENDRAASATAPVRPETMTVAELAHRWLAATAERRVPDAQATEVQRTRDYILAAIGSVLIGDVNASHIRRVHEESRTGTRGQPLSQTTRRHIHMTCVAMFRWAVRQGFLMSNPTDKTDPPKKDFIPRRIIPATQQAAVVEAVRTMGPARDSPDWMMSAAVRLSLATGARQGELVGLRWRDWDPARQVLTVARSISRQNSVREGGKSQRIRHVRLSDSMTEWMGRWRATLKALGDAHGLPHPTAEDPIVTWVTPRGSPAWRGHVRPQLISRWWSSNRLEVAEIVGDPSIGDVVWHGQRHSLITAAIESGVSPHDVGAVVGHHAVESTRGYWRDGGASAGRVADALPDLG